jgi:Uma2 family endonuclease
MPDMATVIEPEAVPPFPVHRFSVAEYRQLAETGLLTERDRVELIEGWIVPKMIHNPPHDAALELVDQELRGLLPPGWRMRMQAAIETADSCPEPDAAIVRGAIRDHARRHPTGNEIGLIVEIADTSLDRDRRKSQVYAEAGVPHYWILNLVDRRLETYSKPLLSAKPARYRRRTDYAESETAPLVIDGAVVGEVSVASLLP